MKFEKVDTKTFEPIAITLENELECEVMSCIFAANPIEISRACIGTSSESIRKCFSKDEINTAYEQLTAIQEK